MEIKKTFYFLCRIANMSFLCPNKLLGKLFSCQYWNSSHNPLLIKRLRQSITLYKKWSIKNLDKIWSNIPFY